MKDDNENGDDYDGAPSKKKRQSTSRSAKLKSNRAIVQAENIEAILSQQVIVKPPNIDKDDLSENTLLDIYEDAVLFITTMDYQH